MEKERILLNEKQIFDLAKKLKRFFENNSDHAKKAIENVIRVQPYLSSAEIFRQLSADKGVRKPHMSVKKDGDLAYGRNYPSRKRGRQNRRRLL